MFPEISDQPLEAELEHSQAEEDAVSVPAWTLADVVEPAAQADNKLQSQAVVHAANAAEPHDSDFGHKRTRCSAMAGPLLLARLGNTQDTHKVVEVDPPNTAGSDAASNRKDPCEAAGNGIVLASHTVGSLLLLKYWPLVAGVETCV